MTREEARKVIKDGLEDMSLDYIDIEQYEALTMAIKALEQNESAEEWYKLFVEKLEQEPSGDLISRQATLNAIIKELCIKDESYLLQSEKTIYNVVKKMPPVNPQEPKTGHWEWIKYDSNPEIGNFHCSECNFIPASFNWASKHLNYCPNCGAKMESEDKE